MLDGASEKGYSKIVSWNDDGKSFSIHDKARFMADVMPLYFESSRFKAFQRSLNLWGFYTINRKKTGREQQIMHHFFQRGIPNQCIHMKRLKIKRSETKQLVEGSLKNFEGSDSARRHRGDDDSTAPNILHHNRDGRSTATIKTRQTESSQFSSTFIRGQGLEPDHFYPTNFQATTLEQALGDIIIGLKILQALHFVSHCQALNDFEPQKRQITRSAEWRSTASMPE